MPAHSSPSYQRKWYLENKDKVAATSKRHYNKKRDFIRLAKNKPCADCGQAYPYYVMDFDHVRGEKKFSLSPKPNHQGGSSSKSYQAIKDEIAKCDVVCSNCHRTRSFKRKENALYTATASEPWNSNF